MISWQDLATGVALALVLEGILPFLAPRQWRETITRIAEFDEGTLRRIGLGCMAVGVVLLSLVR